MSGFRTAVVALCAVVLTAGCAAGRHSQTAEEKPSIDGTLGSVGDISLDGVALATPDGTSYPRGSAVPLMVYISNTGGVPDRLVRVSSPAFSGWNIVPTAGAATATAGNPAPPKIAGGSAVGYGLEDLGPNGQASPTTLVLTGLSIGNAPLYPGMSVPVTFSFANAGTTTLQVPVRLSRNPDTATLPNEPSQSEAG